MPNKPEDPLRIKILKLYLQGFSQRQIGAKLHCTTVAYHLNTDFAKRWLAGKIRQSVPKNGRPPLPEIVNRFRKFLELEMRDRRYRVKKMREIKEKLKAGMLSPRRMEFYKRKLRDYESEIASAERGAEIWRETIRDYSKAAKEMPDSWDEHS